MLCDFGLSRIKADTISRTVAKSDGKGVAGSRHWMAPERLLGGLLKTPCDIYALGMTIYEVSRVLDCVMKMLRLNQQFGRFSWTRFR